MATKKKATKKGKKKRIIRRTGQLQSIKSEQPKPVQSTAEGSG